MRKAKKSYEDSYYCTAVNSGGYEFEDVDVKVGGEDVCKLEWMCIIKVLRSHFLGAQAFIVHGNEGLSNQEMEKKRLNKAFQSETRPANW